MHRIDDEQGNIKGYVEAWVAGAPFTFETKSGNYDGFLVPAVATFDYAKGIVCTDGFPLGREIPWGFQNEDNFYRARTFSFNGTIFVQEEATDETLKKNMPTDIVKLIVSGPSIAGVDKLVQVCNQLSLPIRCGRQRL